jgi:hypothetical protein
LTRSLALKFLNSEKFNQRIIAASFVIKGSQIKKPPIGGFFYGINFGREVYGTRQKSGE